MKKPLLQTENRVWRTYRGGKQLDEFLGKSSAKNSFWPEDWISSFVEAKNKNYIPKEGISKVLIDGEERLITEVVTKEDFGPNWKESGVLIKLLDASERLGIQVHPTPDYSRKHFGTNHGKTECWHILSVDKEADAAIYIGFKEGITKEKWARLFAEQDVEGMLDCLHRFEVKAGDTILVTAGTPHAIGAGCFLLEIQEPTDYTMRVEKTTVAGEILTPMQIHYGVGEEKLLDCFIYDGLSRKEARKKYFLLSKNKTVKNGGTCQVLVSYEDTTCFALEKISGGNAAVFPDSFLTLVVINRGSVKIGEVVFEVKRGDKIFVPYDCGTIIVETAEVILCYPPAITVYEFL